MTESDPESPVGMPPVSAKSSAETAELIRGCQGLVRSIAWKIHQKLPSHVDLDDLIGYGQIGLAEAARDFDGRSTVRFTTYAYYRVRGSILDGLSKMTWFSKAEFSRGHYDRAANDVLAPTADGDDASGQVGWFRDTARALSVACVLSLARPDGAMVDPVDESSLIDPAEQAELLDAMKCAMASLEQRERDLLTAVYFEGESIKSAGQRIGISKAWASRLHARTLTKLADTLGAGDGFGAREESSGDPRDDVSQAGDSHAGSSDEVEEGDYCEMQSKPEISV